MQQSPFHRLTVPQSEKKLHQNHHGPQNNLPSLSIWRIDRNISMNIVIGLFVIVAESVKYKYIGGGKYIGQIKIRNNILVMQIEKGCLRVYVGLWYRNQQHSLTCSGPAYSNQYLISSFGVSSMSFFLATSSSLIGII